MEDIKIQYELMKDEFLKEKFLVASPYPTILILTSYLYIVLVYGPKLMKDKKPYELKSLMLVYNVVQILMNLYILYSTYIRLTLESYDYYCLIASKEILNIGYIYYLVKILDLFETIIFVLKKKHTQISFLHVYHHVIVLSFSSWAMGSIAAGHGIVYGIINCSVHVVMYVYYFISAYNPNSKWLRMKKFVTQMQLVQFVILFFHFLWPLLFGHCTLRLVHALFGISQAVTMMYLFGKFYINTYIRQNKTKE